MKSISKLLTLLTVTMLMLLLGMQNVLPVKADAPNQTITILTNAPLSAANGESFTVEATSDSGLEVSYSAAGVCSNVGATFTMTSDSGNCTVQYDQAGDGTYDPAPQLTKNVTAQPAAIETATATVTEEATATETPTETVTPSATPTFELDTPTITVTVTVEADTQTPTASPSITGTATKTKTRTPTITTTVTPPTFYVSTTGNNSNTCKSPALPCLTINGALGKAANGDIIKVAVGVYRANVVIAKRITLLGGWNTAFTAQNGMSTNELGIWVGIYSITTIDRFIITKGSPGIFNFNGNITLNNSVVKNNEQGIFNGGTLAINNSSIINNTIITDGLGGGGIDNSFALTIRNSLISHNNVINGYGGGIANSATLKIYNSTISNNKARFGGGISTGEVVTVNNSTISDNIAAVGGGISGKSFLLSNTIIAGNISTFDENADCYATIISSGYNLIGKTSTECKITTSTGDLLNVNPKLGKYTGDAIGYYPLIWGSPAINAGNPAASGSSANTCITKDQRGITRPRGVRCDIGSYEYSTPGMAHSLVAVDKTHQRSGPRIQFLKPLQVVVRDSLGNPVSGVTVTFTAPPLNAASGIFSDTGTNITTAITDAGGIATAAALTANNKQGSYIVHVTAVGISASIDFSMTNLVWFVAPTGNNANTCATISTPCKTINGALSKATAGDTIFVAKGIYNDTGANVVKITKSIVLLGGWDAAFTVQNDVSTIDGQNLRRGIWLTGNELQTVTIDRFVIRHGFTTGGGAILNDGMTLLLTNSILANNVSVGNGGGIANYGFSTINNTLITQNVGGETHSSGASGGGGIYNGPNGHYSVILNNSLVSSNTIVGGYDGSGIYNDGSFTLNNSTISDNGKNTASIVASSGITRLNNSTVSDNGGGGIRQTIGDLAINNSTISGNQSGLIIFGSYSVQTTLRNSIIAGNSTDCYGKLNSAGYNLIGKITTGCTFTKTTGDLTNIDVKFGQLTGFPGYVPLLPSSPAINAGSPTTCLPTDQRGQTRPLGPRCDIGAYEYRAPSAAKRMGVLRGSYESTPTGSAYSIPLTLYVVDQFGSPVANVTVTFLVPSTAGPSGKFGNSYSSTAVTNANGLAIAPTFTANNQPGEFTVIATVTGLAGSPAKFTLTNSPIPTLLSPTNHITVATPTYQWTKVIGATQYQYELSNNDYFNPLIYTKVVGSDVCRKNICSSTPGNILSNNLTINYRWRVRAMVGSVWQSYSDDKLFNLIFPSGFWSGDGAEFYATPDHAYVTNFSIYVPIDGCGTYKITVPTSMPVDSSTYHFSSAFSNNTINIGGTFRTLTYATGFIHISSINIPRCGNMTDIYYRYTATWQNYMQPALALKNNSITPINNSAISGDLKVERVKP